LSCLIETMPDDILGRPQQPGFGTTKWSLVLLACGSKTGESEQAFHQLIEAYWYPLYAFARRRGNNDHDAMDLTQGFMIHLLSADALQTVSPEKGRFRTYLLAAFQNYMANQHRASQTVRRGGAANLLSLSTREWRERYDREPYHEETPELLFEKSWIETIFERVKNRLADAYHCADKDRLFELLEPHLTKSIDVVPRSEICRELNLSAAAVAMSLHRMRRRYGELLREEVAATIDDPADVDDELRTLMAIVSQP